VTDASSTPHRYPTIIRTSGTPTPHFQPNFVSADISEARDFEDRLRHAEKKGSFLALTVKLCAFERARQELTSRFNTRPLDVEGIFVQALRQSAKEVKADLNVVINSDAAQPQSSDWRNLNHLISSKVIPRVEEAILQGDRTVLAYHVNWLARYDQVVMLSRIYEAVQAGKVHGVWLLLPASPQTSMPVIDGQAVPVITTNQWASIPESWCQNLHRAMEAKANG
jgi:hypothetical protein